MQRISSGEETTAPGGVNAICENLTGFARSSVLFRRNKGVPPPNSSSVTLQPPCWPYVFYRLRVASAGTGYLEALRLWTDLNGSVTLLIRNKGFVQDFTQPPARLSSCGGLHFCDRTRNKLALNLGPNLRKALFNQAIIWIRTTHQMINALI